MAYVGFYRAFRAIAYASLSMVALLAFVFPSMADPAPAAVLAMDRLGHDLQINGVAPDPASSIAFGNRALTHELYCAGSFGLGRCDIRL